MPSSESLPDILRSRLPKHVGTLPVSGRRVMYTPFLVRDQKHLSFIVGSKEPVAMMAALVSVLANCSDVADPRDLAPADAEYLFLMIRSVSLGEDLLVRIGEGDEAREVAIPFDDIHASKGADRTIISPAQDVTIHLRAPKVADFLDGHGPDTPGFVGRLVEKVCIGKETYRPERFVPGDVASMIENLPISDYKDIRNFLDGLPHLYHDAQGPDGPVRIRGLLRFFPLR